MKLIVPKLKDILEINKIYVEGAVEEIKFQFSKRTKKDILKEMKKYEKERISGMKKGIKSKNEYWLIVLEKNEMIGFGQAVINKKDKTKAEIEKVYVLKQFRGKGVGLKITKELIKWLKKKKVKEIINKIFFENKPSMKMHERLGFKIVGVGMHKRLK